MDISRAAFDLIVVEEVSSQATYEAQYRKPERPGGASGITIGIGYDCGYSTPLGIQQDWGGRINQAMVDALKSVAGLTGTTAEGRLEEMRRKVDVPWQAAIDVFMNIDIPRWTASVRKALPNTDKLSPDCLGVLVSLAYNRGVSFSNAGDRYVEMRAIKQHMLTQRFELIPRELRAMKRLWVTPSVKGVATRREHEALLFERGLKSIIVHVPAASGNATTTVPLPPPSIPSTPVPPVVRPIPPVVASPPTFAQSIAAAFTSILSLFTRKKP